MITPSLERRSVLGSRFHLVARRSNRNGRRGRACWPNGLFRECSHSSDQRCLEHMIGNIAAVLLALALPDRRRRGGLAVVVRVVARCRSVAPLYRLERRGLVSITGSACIRKMNGTSVNPLQRDVSSMRFHLAVVKDQPVRYDPLLCSLTRSIGLVDHQQADLPLNLYAQLYGGNNGNSRAIPDFCGQASAISR